MYYPVSRYIVQLALLPSLQQQSYLRLIFLITRKPRHVTSASSAPSSRSLHRLDFRRCCCGSTDVNLVQLSLCSAAATNASKSRGVGASMKIVPSRLVIIYYYVQLEEIPTHKILLYIRQYGSTHARPIHSPGKVVSPAPPRPPRRMDAAASEGPRARAAAHAPHTPRGSMLPKRARLMLMRFLLAPTTKWEHLSHSNSLCGEQRLVHNF